MKILNGKVLQAQMRGCDWGNTYTARSAKHSISLWKEKTTRWWYCSRLKQANLKGITSHSMSRWQPLWRNKGSHWHTGKVVILSSYAGISSLIGRTLGCCARGPRFETENWTRNLQYRMKGVAVIFGELEMWKAQHAPYAGYAHLRHMVSAPWVRWRAAGMEMLRKRSTKYRVSIGCERWHYRPALLQQCFLSHQTSIAHVTCVEMDVVTDNKNKKVIPQWVISSIVRTMQRGHCNCASGQRVARLTTTQVFGAAVSGSLQ